MHTITLADGRTARVRDTIDTPVGRVRVDGPVRLVIDFASAAGAIGFADMLMADHPAEYDNADVFAMDGLDEAPATTRFILKRATDRIPGTALREILGFESVVEYRIGQPATTPEEAPDA